MSMSKLFSYKNLDLAWRRMNTGSNYQYKRYYRELYYAYEVAVSQNLKDLQIRLKGGSYKPKESTRIYIPKPSGLQRPITLLELEDQIVWQAVANVFAEKLRPKRSKVELTKVFSNILNNDTNSIFFVKNWKHTYGYFLDKIRQLYHKDYKWVAHFDLAAFYDTISHELLIKELFPRSGGTEFKKFALDCLRRWSTEKVALNRGHGIPQGPLASNFLAECFLLSIDQSFSNERRSIYIRYVDDIRLFAKSRSDIERASVRLEVLCRDKGLIPQGKKYGVRKAISISDALGSLPSIRQETGETVNGIVFMSKGRSIKRIREALASRPQRIKDKSRARYVFFNAEPCPELTKYAVRLLPRHPELIDAFVKYFSNCKRSTSIVSACERMLKRTHYEYVQGELWHILAEMMTQSEMRRFLGKAVNIAKNNNANLSVKWGALHFLCRAEEDGLGKYSKFLQYQKNSLLQALLVPIIPNNRYGKDDVVRKLLKRTSFEPGLMLAQELAKRKLNHNNFGCKSSSLPKQVQNVFRELGLIRGPMGKVDPMGEILSKRYGIAAWDKWRDVFGGEYVHGLQILSAADAIFDSGKSKWLGLQNSFNHAMFLVVQKCMQKYKMKSVCKLIDKRGRAIDYGVLLDKNQVFPRVYPRIANGLRLSNDRRNSLRESHPYCKRSGKRTTWLTKGEQDKLKKKLKESYQEIIKLLSGVL